MSPQQHALEDMPMVRTIVNSSPQSRSLQPFHQCVLCVSFNLSPMLSGSSKSALTKTTGVQHKPIRMNPKAIRAEEMFGETNKASGEWVDGVFAAMWSKFNDRNRKDMQVCTKCSRRGTSRWQIRSAALGYLTRFLRNHEPSLRSGAQRYHHPAIVFTRREVYLQRGLNPPVSD